MISDRIYTNSDPCYFTFYLPAVAAKSNSFLLRRYWLCQWSLSKNEMPCSKNLRAELKSVYFIASLPAFLFSATTMFAWPGSDSTPFPPQLTDKQDKSKDCIKKW